jgi:hypothetical protein
MGSNTMSKCLNCNGTGYVPKHKNCHHSSYDAYIYDCHEQRRCRTCHGFGLSGSDKVRAILLEIKLSTKETAITQLAELAIREWDSVGEKK